MIFKNPLHAASNVLMLGIGVVALSVSTSVNRILTVKAERERFDIAASRVQQCRILHRTQTLQAGYYYFQPTTTDKTGKLRGALLAEGTYVCDWYGNSGRIDRNGALDHFVTSDPWLTDKTGGEEQNPVI